MAGLFRFTSGCLHSWVERRVKGCASRAPAAVEGSLERKI